MRNWHRKLLPVLALWLVSCGDLEKLPTDPGGEEPPDPSATFSRVQAEVFTPSCALAGCHGAVATQAGMNLTQGNAYAQIVSRQSVESTLVRIQPGVPGQSYLFLKITGSPLITGDRMPQGKAPLPEEKIRLIRDWIRRGAPND